MDFFEIFGKSGKTEKSVGWELKSKYLIFFIIFKTFILNTTFY